MKLKEWTLTARGIFSLFMPWLSVKPFAKADVEREIEVNQAFARKSASQLADYQLEYEAIVKERLRAFRSGVWRSFWFLLTAVIVALIVAAFWHASPKAKTLLGGLSIFVFAW